MTHQRHIKTTIDLGKIRANYLRLQRQAAKGCMVAGVVKADAYGLGLSKIASTLWEAGCRLFFVSTTGEGVALRSRLPTAKISILGGILPQDLPVTRNAALIPVLSCLEHIALWRESGGGAAMIKVDTGMNRLGLNARDIQALHDIPVLLKGIDVQAIISHFACADDPYHPLTHRQNTLFADIAQKFPHAARSLANSDGFLANAEYHYDIARVGYGLYDGAVEVSAPILHVKNVPKGSSIGYGATHIFTQDTRVATLACGYADGFLRCASGQAMLYWNGVKCPVLGRISMDLISVDVGDLNPPLGAVIEIIGPHQSVQTLAKTCGTIGYEILTTLVGQSARLYKE